MTNYTKILLSIFDGRDLHYSVCGGQAELQKDRQELPDE